MPVPNHPDKHGADPVVTPDPNDDATLPPHILLTYSHNLFEYITDSYDGDHIDRYYGDLYTVSDRVGVLGDFGIGAPTTAMLMEDLIADGATTFLSIGFAGALDRTIAVGDTVLCARAIRDDGTSHHYREPATYAHPSEPLFTHTETTVTDRVTPYHVGASWTIDAIYRETTTEVEAYGAQGVLTVEMEAATVFTVATHHDVDAAAMFTVSDHLTPDEWDPHFETALDDLTTLGDTAIAVLDTYAETQDATSSPP